MIRSEGTTASGVPPPQVRRRAVLRGSFGRSGAIRTGEAVIGGVAFLLLLQAVLGYNVFDPVFWNRFQRTLWQGFFGTLGYVAIMLPVSLVLGFLAGWARLSRLRSVAWPAAVYVDLFRGMPPIVLAIFAFLFGPLFLPEQYNTQSMGLLFAAFALAAHSGAYQAEIFRAGFQSVPRGQVEAAHALGLSPPQVMAFVVLPQSVRLSLPPLANELATLVKDSSLLGALGAVEMVALGQEFNQQIVIFGGQLTWVFGVWTVIAALYFVLAFAVTRVLLFVERWFRVPGMEGVAA